MVAPVISAFGFTHVLKIQTLDLYLEVDNDQFLHRRFYISPYKSCNKKFFWLSSVYSLSVYLMTAGCHFIC